MGGLKKLALGGLNANFKRKVLISKRIPRTRDASNQYGGLSESCACVESPTGISSSCLIKQQNISC